MYINLLTKIKNAEAAKKKSLNAKYSKMDYAIVEALVKYGFLKNGEVKGRSFKKVIEIDLHENPVIRGIKFLSLPSRRIYSPYKELRARKARYRTVFLSTPQGILIGKEATKKKVGGQLLFEIW